MNETSVNRNINQGLPSFDELYERVDRRAPGLGVAAAGGDDPTVLIALNEAASRGWVKPILCGSREKIVELADSLQIDLKPFTILESETPAVTAVQEIHAGRAAMLMKGQIDTPSLMAAVLDRENGLRTDQTIGQIVLMEVLKDRKSFLLTDTGITVQPSLEQLQSLLEQMVNVIRDLGCETPRIGLMAATEKVTSKMPETEQISRLVEWSGKRYLEPEVQVSGPLSFDLAYASKAGERKRLDDVVIGHANGMLFPNLLSANLTVKAIMYTADCRFGGILCGTSAPVVFMSRADDVPTRLNSLAYTLELISGRE